MPTRRGRSISGAPKSVKSEKQFYQKIAYRASYEHWIAIDPDQFFNRDRDRDEHFQIKM
jgi:hypothetical protein